MVDASLSAGLAITVILLSLFPAGTGGIGPAGTIRTESASPALARSLGEGPSFIFINGQVVTVEPTIPTAEALMVQGARIRAVGSNAMAHSARTPGTAVIDLEGRALVPGFIDGHTHLLAQRPEDKTLGDAIDVALRYGVTTIQELSVREWLLDELFDAERQDRLHMRVNAYPAYNAAFPDDEGRTVILEQWFPARGPILEVDRMLRIPGIKIFADWVGCPALTEPYPEEVRNSPDFACRSDRGDPYFSQEELNRVVAAAQDMGFRVVIHALGDRAIDMVLNAVEQSLDGASNKQYRHQIHHNSILRPDQFPRYSDLRMLTSVRGYLPTCWQEDPKTWLGLDRYEWYYNRYALPGLKQVHAFNEGDFAWTFDPDDKTGFRPINPLLSLYGLVTRKQLQEDGTTCDPNPTVARHRITAEQALRMVTIEGAYAVSMEKEIGSLKPGKYADLVVLSANPLTVAPDEIKDIEALLTMVNGRVEYCAPIYAFLCTQEGDQNLRGVPSVSGYREVVLRDPQAGGDSLLARSADSESLDGRARTRA